MQRLRPGPDDPLTIGEAAPLLDAVAFPDAGSQVEGLSDNGSSDDEPVCIAVSGGPDSTALLLMADQWARLRDRDLLVLTVDHKLRPEAGDEAAAVAALSTLRGWPHRILHWTGPKPSSGLQAAAREARYRLLIAACHRAAASVLLVGHHLDDQIETVLHRLERESGPLGLAGMAGRRSLDGVVIARPFLGIEKSRLEITCRVAGVRVVSDPSNHDRRFARGRLRAMQGALDEVGLTRDRLSRFATVMGRVRRLIDTEVGRRLECGGVRLPTGGVRLTRTAYDAAPERLRRYLLRAMLAVAAGGGYPPRGRSLDDLETWIAMAPDGGVRTLAGCLVGVDGTAITVCREVAACAGPLDLPPGATGCWDGRFLVVNRGNRPVRVQACGHKGWRRRRLLGVEDASDGSAGTLDHQARLGAPVVLDLDGGMAVPHLVTQAGGLSTILQNGVYLRALSTAEVAATS